jgi:predicted amino acid racemase
MLLERVLERNPAIVEAAVELHQDGMLPTGSWLFDLDAIARNARAIAAEADRLGLDRYLMTKQIARNPMVVALALHLGLNKTVCVDIQCARQLHRYRLPIGHVGHLNQLPRDGVAQALRMHPDVVTVFSVEAAQMVNDVAEGLGLRQKLLMRVHKPGDVFFPGQEGGFLEHELIDAARQIQAMPNVEITGVTTFPVMSYEFGADKEQSFNPNMGTIVAAARRLRDEAGVDVTMINAPGNTSTTTLAMLAEGGATCVEPGHGLLGTSIPQINEPGHPEIPTYVFVTEVSHHHDGQAYGIAGGGLWADMGGFMNPDWKLGGLVGTTGQSALGNRMDYRHLDQIIDYHIPLIPGDRAKIGDTVVFPIYTQAHMTRAYVVPVSGISAGKPRVRGVFDTSATMLDRNYDPVHPSEVMRLIDELLDEYPKN